MEFKTPIGCPKRPTARLLSTIGYPLETVYCLWQASRTKEHVPQPEDLHSAAMCDLELYDDIRRVFHQVIDSDIPVAENLDFIFLLENIPVSLREQIVRHRIGHRFGENFAVDMVPGDVQSSWWSQSMRVLDMGEFAAAGDYYQPDSINDTLMIESAEGDDLMKADELYARAMLLNQRAYQLFIKAGVPPEDARQVIPLAACSRLTWKMNYQALKHIVRRRGCWIAQLGMWRPIIMDIVNELCLKVDECFRSMITPPCIQQESFVGCPFIPDNIQRMMKRDPEPPCSLFLKHHGHEAMAECPDSGLMAYFPNRDGTWDTTEAKDRQRFQDLQAAYGELWGRNVWSGMQQ